ncbi:ABC transporter substrate-binding protein [Tistrella bauzanensis]|uniref:ABC transporter substrate-binding protein n=1 Tax=Tistrella arctica TaxID=3133430 RepID=A0ABU9YQI2_9PROT
MTDRTRSAAARAAFGLMAGIIALGAAERAAHAADPIRIGEINSYSALPAFTEPYRKGWQLALDEVNAAGGVLGRPLEVVSRDDAGKPADAINAANELVTREDVALVAGTFFSHVGLAVADYAARRDVFFLAAEPLTDAMVWSKGNDVTFRLRPSNHMQAAMLAEEAAKLPAKRWATIAPNYEYGQSAVAVFKELLSARRPDIEWVGEQWPPQGKIDAGPVAQAIAATNPDAILNVTFGPDLVKLVREGTTRGLFKDRAVVSFLTGEPEYLDPLGAEAPEGWIVTGYPWYDIDTPAHKAFLDAYQARWNDHPRLGSIVGYVTIKSIAAIIAKAGATDTAALVQAARGIGLETPFGPITYRAADHQSTLGAFVGRTAVIDGRGRMVDAVYRDGADYLPDEATAGALRPAR